MLGRAEDLIGDAASSEATLFAASLAAIRAGHDEAHADAEIELVYAAGVDRAERDVADRAAATAEALLARLGDAGERRVRLSLHEAYFFDAAGRYPEARAKLDEALRADTRSGRGPSQLRGGILTEISNLDFVEGHYPEAVTNGRRALAAAEEAGGPHHPNLGIGHSNLGSYFEATGRVSDALDEYGRALAIQEAIAGDNPELATTLANQGLAYARLGRDEEAVTLLRRAIALSDRMTASSPHLALYHLALAGVLERLGRWAEARAACATALELQTKRWGPDDADVGRILQQLGELAMDEGKLDEAIGFLARAVAILTKKLGESDDVAKAVGSLGEARFRRGQTAEGLADAVRARDLLVKTLGASHRSVGFAETTLGGMQARLGAHDQALATYERACAILAGDEGDARARAEARFGLAKELWASGRDRPRALALARDAQADLRPLGPAVKALRGDVDGWLARNAR